MRTVAYFFVLAALVFGNADVFGQKVRSSHLLNEWFSKQRFAISDKNGDGGLNRTELEEFPMEWAYFLDESYFIESDVNSDGRLSELEIRRVAGNALEYRLTLEQGQLAKLEKTYPFFSEAKPIYFKRLPELSEILVQNLTWAQTNPEVISKLLSQESWLEENPEVVKSLQRNLSWLVQNPSIAATSYRKRATRKFVGDMEDWRRNHESLLDKRKELRNGAFAVQLRNEDISEAEILAAESSLAQSNTSENAEESSTVDPEASPEEQANQLQAEAVQLEGELLLMVAQLEAENQSLKSVEEELRFKVKELQDALARASRYPGEEEILNLKRKIAELRVAKSNLETELSLIAADERESQNSSLEMSEEMRSLKQEVYELRNSNARYRKLALADEESIKADNEELELQVQQLQQVIAEMSDGGRTGGYVSRPISVTAQNKEIDRLKKALFEKEDELLNLTRSWSELSGTIGQMNVERNLLIDSLAIVENNYLSQMSALEVQLREMEWTAEKTASNQSGYTVRIDSLNQLIQSQASQISSMQSSHARQLDSLSEIKSGQDMQIATLTASLTSLEDEMSVQPNSQDLAKVRAEVAAEYEARIAELEESQQASLVQVNDLFKQNLETQQSLHTSQKDSLSKLLLDQASIIRVLESQVVDLESVIRENPSPELVESQLLTIRTEHQAELAKKDQQYSQSLDSLIAINQELDREKKALSAAKTVKKTEALDQAKEYRDRITKLEAQLATQSKQKLAVEAEGRKAVAAVEARLDSVNRQMLLQKGQIKQLEQKSILADDREEKLAYYSGQLAVLEKEVEEEARKAFDAEMALEKEQRKFNAEIKRLEQQVAAQEKMNSAAQLSMDQRTEGYDSLMQIISLQKSQITAANIENNYLKNQSDSLVQQNEQQLAEISRLESIPKSRKVANSPDQVKEYRTRIQKLELQLAEQSKAKLDAQAVSRKELAEAKEEISTLTQKLLTRKGQVQQLEDRVNRQAAEIARFDETASSNEQDLKLQIQQLNASLASANEQNADNRLLTDSLKTDAQRYQSRLAILENQLNEQEKELASYEEKVSSEKAALVSANINEKAELERIKDLLEREKSSYQWKIDSLIDQNLKANVRILELTEDVEMKDQELTQMETEQEKNMTVSQKESQVRIRDLEAREKILLKERDSLLVVQSNMDDTYKEMQAQVSVLEKKINEESNKGKESLTQTESRYQEQLTAFQQLLDQQEIDAENAMKKARDSFDRELRAQARRFDHERDSMILLNRSLQTQTEIQVKNIKTLEEALSQEKDQTAKMAVQKPMNESDLIDSLQSELQFLLIEQELAQVVEDSLLATTIRQRRKIDDEKDARSRDSASFELSISALHGQIAALEAERDTLEEALLDRDQSSNAYIEEIRHQRDSLEGQLDRQNQQVKQLFEQQDGEEIEKNQLRGQIESLEYDNQKLREHLESRIEEASRAEDRMKVQIAKLEAQNQALDDKLTKRKRKPRTPIEQRARSMEDQVAVLEQESIDLKIEKEAMGDQIHSLENYIRQVRESEQSLQRQVNAQKATNNDLNFRLDSVTQVLNSFQSYNWSDSIDYYRKKLLIVEAANENQRGMSIAREQDYTQDLDSLQAEIASLKSELKAARKGVRFDQRRINKLEERERKIRKQEREMQKENKILKQQARVLEERQQAISTMEARYLRLLEKEKELQMLEQQLKQQKR